MSLDPGADQKPEVIAPGIERIARFDHFNVWRADGRAGEFSLPSNIPYVVLMAVGGNVNAGALTLEGESAAFVPCAAITNTRVLVAEGAQVLLAAPGL